MSKRVRNLRLHIMVDHDELAIIKDSMKELGCCNRGAFLRKMAIDGYATNVDISPAKELISLQRRCVNKRPRRKQRGITGERYKEPPQGGGVLNLL